MWKPRAFAHLLISSVLTFELVQAQADSTGTEPAATGKAPIIDLNLPIVAKVGELEFRECVLMAQDRERKTQCAWFAVPENPQAPLVKTINLLVLRIPAKSPSEVAPDPMLFIAGGPGQAASETFLFADYIWSQLAKKRDFYLVDQRGTGHSSLMSCAAFDEQEFATHEYDSEKVKSYARECLESLPGDPRFYTTDISVKDFERLREALAVPQWNLLGASYGTRVSTHYMRVFPQSVRTAVLDSVVPPQHVLGPDIALRSQQVLDKLFERCENNQQCKSRIPDLKAEVTALLTQLADAPVKIKVENFRTGKIEDAVFTRHHLVTLIRMYLYNPKTFALLPPMLHEAAANNNYSPIARQALATAESASKTIALGLHNSVLCTEEYPYYKQTPEDKNANANTYMGADQMQSMEDMCSVWPKGELIPEMKTPLISDIPTLLLSGEYDPITPAEYAAQTLTGLKFGRHFVLKGQGHFVSGIGCMPNLIENFIHEKSSNQLDAQCLERLSASPLFVNFNGPSP